MEAVTRFDGTRARLPHFWDRSAPDRARMQEALRTRAALAAVA